MIDVQERKKKMAKIKKTAVVKVDQDKATAAQPLERYKVVVAAVMNGVYKGSAFEFGTASLRPELATMFAHKI